MKITIFRIIMFSYLLLSLVVLVTYSQAMKPYKVTWEGQHISIRGACRAIKKPVPLHTLGTYKVDAPNGSVIITREGISTNPEELNLKLRGIYFYYIGPLNQSVVLRLTPQPRTDRLALYLGLTLVGGVSVALAFRMLGFE
ncbi:hypothetical protein [Thermococcus sp. AM4]|uniref:hypothetical protein n=1 Tax=Thermococcus sp. (strain AM4) TaxID=246969 RepID=UPI00064F3DB5|nr:hypothetical protein [Thermococcus sp. AM4]